MFGSWYDPLTGQVVIVPSSHPPFYPFPCHPPAYGLGSLTNHGQSLLFSTNQNPENFQQQGFGLENKKPINGTQVQDQVCTPYFRK
jgi:hypothetical protein